jgi:hypothetical protein
MKPDAPPVYAIVDHRQGGKPRIVGEYVDPLAATVAADLVRAAGADVQVELISSIVGPK